IFLKKTARQSSPGSDDFETFFIIVDDHGKSFTASHFGLRRRDDEPVSVADEKRRERVRRPLVVKQLEIFADFHAALFGSFADGDFTEGAHRCSRNRLAAQLIKARDA